MSVCFSSSPRANTIPRLKLGVLGGSYEGVLAVHDEVSGSLILAEPATGTCIRDGVKDRAGKTEKGVTVSCTQNDQFVTKLTTQGANFI